MKFIHNKMAQPKIRLYPLQPAEAELLQRLKNGNTVVQKTVMPAGRIK